MWQRVVQQKLCCLQWIRTISINVDFKIYTIKESQDKFIIWDKIDKLNKEKEARIEIENGGTWFQ